MRPLETIAYGLILIVLMVCFLGCENEGIRTISPSPSGLTCEERDEDGKCRILIIDKPPAPADPCAGKVYPQAGDNQITCPQLPRH